LASELPEGLNLKHLTEASFILPETIVARTKPGRVVRIHVLKLLGKVEVYRPLFEEQVRVSLYGQSFSIWAVPDDLAGEEKATVEECLACALKLLDANPKPSGPGMM